jgi:hypothetical protein
MNNNVQSCHTSGAEEEQSGHLSTSLYYAEVDSETSMNNKKFGSVSQIGTFSDTFSKFASVSE